MKNILKTCKGFLSHRATKSALIALGALLLLAAVIFSCIALFGEPGQTPSPSPSETTAAEVYDKILPSTVSVLTYYEGQSSLGYGGSGFFISEDGLIATAYHVVEGAHRILVRTSDRKEYEVAYVAGYDRALDVALLKIDLDGTVPVTVAANVPEEGAVLYALGRNSGLDFTFSDGILAKAGDVHAKYPKRNMLRYCNLTQKGNSGCAIFNADGDAVGMSQFRDTTYGTVAWALVIEQVMSVPADMQLSPAEMAENEALDLTDYLSFHVKDGAAYIDGFAKQIPTDTVVIKVPATIDGMPVRSLSLAGSTLPSVRQILLPEGITALGRAFLSESNKIAVVHIPSSVTEISPDAFYGTASLSKITSDSAALAITEAQVSSADGKTLYRLLKTPEDGVLSLDGVAAVADYAVYGRSVTHLTDTDALTYVGAYAFARSKLESFAAENLDTLGKRAFYGCTLLTDVTLSPALTRIEDEAFSACTALARVYLPEGVVYIGTSAFANTALHAIILPESLSYVSADAFNGARLSSVTLASLPRMEALSAFGDTEQIAKITFALPAALASASQSDPMYKTLFAIGAVTVLN